MVDLSKKGKSFPFNTVFATAQEETVISSSSSVLVAATHTFLMSHDCMILKGNHMQTVEPTSPEIAEKICNATNVASV